MPRTLTAAVATAALALLAGACSSSTPGNGASGPGGTSAVPGTTPGSAPRATATRPAGPAATFEEITVAGRPFMGSATGGEIPAGIEEHEYVAIGTATDYKAPSPLSPDGVWTFTPGTTAAYRTRVVVRRPAQASAASGTAVVEWLNVSSGLDANPDYASAAEEITRKGHIWVGVSAQLIGVSGGPVLVKVPGVDGILGKGLKALVPDRYGSLEHPGDGYAFDIYTQVARAVRAGGPVTGGVTPQVVLAAGESQSAIALTTYYNGVQPLTKAFDGFLVHSRAFAALPVVEPGKYADLAGGMTQNPVAVRFRTDQEAPVLDLQTEGDVAGLLNSYAVRQPDSDRFRLWEVAGTAHADTHLLGAMAANLSCGAPINAGPAHFVVKAALRALDTWVRTGAVPPTAPRLEVSGGDKPAVVRDEDGIAKGGIRSPQVDAPVDVLSGDPPPNPDLICVLMGSTKPLPAARLTARYPSRAAYQAAYGKAADAAIATGMFLPEDREALLADAKPDRLPG